jgi:hypothetical protein
MQTISSKSFLLFPILLIVINNYSYKPSKMATKWYETFSCFSHIGYTTNFVLWDLLAIRYSIISEKL